MGHICNGCTVLYDNFPLFDLYIHMLVALILLPLFIGIFNLIRGKK